MDAELLSDTFVGLADTMVDDFDVIDFLHMLTDRSVRLLSVSAAGVVLAEGLGLDMGQAFTLLREHARTTNQRLTDVARYVIDSPAADLPSSPGRGGASEIIANPTRRPDSGRLPG